LDELLAAVVLTVSTAVTADAPVMAGGAATEQVGGSTAVVGPITVQESATEPVKPLLGLTVIVEVP
jgi:glycine/D-amino acid oxidase-like deaminating enzyme